MALVDDLNSLPSVVVMLSGKRKSGKDFTASIFQKIFGCDQCFILRVADPIKEYYAKEHGLDMSKLMDGSSPYKEVYRKEMVAWGIEQRNKDPGIFCRLASQRPGNDRPIWMLTDARRETDIQYFQDLYGKQRTLAVRIVAADKTRTERGWRYAQGIDDCSTECGLDHYPFQHVVHNNGTAAELEQQCRDLYERHVLKLLEDRQHTDND